MEKNKILSADVLDIIFDGKNKSYGAYDLRKTYNRRLVKATFTTIVLVVFAFLGTVYSNMTGNNHNEKFDVLDATMAKVKPDPTLPPPPPVVPPKVIPLVEPNQIKFLVPVIVDKVPDDEKIQDIPDDAAISNKTVISENKEQIILPPVADPASSVIEAPKKSNEDSVYLTVEMDAQFPGGQPAWARYLQKNLNANIPVDNGAPAGTYPVIVRFIVSKDGSISNVQAETKNGYGMEKEATEIIQRGPKWTPALQNGRNVNAYRRQPITFVVPEQ